MDGGGADLNDRVEQGVTSAGPQPAPVTDEPEGQQAQETPLLALDGFDGPLERLLTLARAHQIDLAHLSLTALLTQLEAALWRAPAMMPLGQKANPLSRIRPPENRYWPELLRVNL